MRPAGSLECKQHEAISVVNRSLHPLGRPGLAHEVATAIAFLASQVIYQTREKPGTVLPASM